jgi:hypothetical protein
MDFRSFAGSPPLSLALGLVKECPVEHFKSFGKRGWLAFSQNAHSLELRDVTSFGNSALQM